MVKGLIRRNCLFVVVTSLLLSASSSLIAQDQDKDLARLTNQLAEIEELRNYSENGFTSNFTGELRTIPSELKSELNQELPGYRFWIAKMSVLIDPPSKMYDLVIITDTNSGEIRGFVWADYWVLRPSKSFSELLGGSHVKSNEAAIRKVTALGRLIAFANNSRIGDSKFENRRAKVELIRGDGVFAILEAKLSRSFQVNRLTITQRDGSKLRHFN